MNGPDPEGLAALNEFYATVLVAARLDELEHLEQRRFGYYPPSFVNVRSPAERKRKGSRIYVWHWPSTPITQLKEEYALLRTELFDE